MLSRSPVNPDRTVLGTGVCVMRSRGRDELSYPEALGMGLDSLDRGLFTDILRKETATKELCAPWYEMMKHDS